MAYIDRNFHRLYKQEGKDSTILRTEDIQGAKPRRRTFDRDPLAYEKMETVGNVGGTELRDGVKDDGKDKRSMEVVWRGYFSPDHLNRMVGSVPGGINRWQNSIQLQKSLLSTPKNPEMWRDYNSSPSSKDKIMSRSLIQSPQRQPLPEGDLWMSQNRQYGALVSRPSSKRQKKSSVHATSEDLTQLEHSKVVARMEHPEIGRSRSTQPQRLQPIWKDYSPSRLDQR